ncbi:MAG: exo-alpha-sialidase [Candidatus Schekmanbacteria bacterium]|nr:exo-alpha-sialidase [Candidatus Schekmanbacteria bacterium]
MSGHKKRLSMLAVVAIIAFAITSRGCAESLATTIVHLTQSSGGHHAIYAASASGTVFISTDQARSWSTVTSPPAPVKNGDVASLYAIAADPLDAATAYVSFYHPYFDEPADVLVRTTDSGGTWSVMQSFPGSAAAAIHVDPTGTLLVGADFGVYVSTDGGFSWKAGKGSESDGFPIVNREVAAFAGSTAPGAFLYAIGEHNSSHPYSDIYRSADGGLTWSRCNSPL